MPAISLADAVSIGRLDAHAQASLCARGELAPIDLVEAAILRIEALDPQLNTITHKAYDHARRAAGTVGAGPMAGVPYLLKDGMDYAGMPLRSGARLHRARIAPISYPLAEAYDAAGLIAVGKSNVPEFGLLPSTESLLYGPARNPWSTAHSPGGSSGGAGAAVAAGLVPLAHAADGGGSIRIPASCCGVVGLKPGRGGNLRARGMHLMEDMLVGDTLLARSVRDVAWATARGRGGAALPDAPCSERLTIAMHVENLFGDQPDDAVVAAVEQTAALCTALGHEVVRIAQPVDGPQVAAAFRTIWAYLAADIVDRSEAVFGSEAIETQLEPWTLGLAAWSRSQQPADLDRMLLQVADASARLRAAFATFDVILSPVLKLPPPRIGALAPDRAFETLLPSMFDYVSYTPLHNLTGMPAISLPLSWTQDGLPVGSMFAADRGREDLLLALAFELEQAQPWKDRWPPHSVAAPVS